MASITEMLLQSGLQTTQQSADLAGAASRGANAGTQLAQHINQVQQQRAQLDMQKQELQMNKVNSVMDTMKIAAQSKDPKMRNFLLKNVVPGKVKALGMEEFFNPQTLEMLQTSDEAIQKVLGLQLDLEDKVNKGEMTGAQAYRIAQGILGNPEELALLDTDRLFEAQKFAASESGKEERAQYVAGASLGKQIQAQQSAGKVEAAKKIGDAYGEYSTAGGAAAIGSNFKNLQSALGDLNSGNVETGKGLVRWIGGSDFAVDIAAPDVAAARDKIRTAIVGTLRPILGGAFAEKEGQRILDLAFNPRAKTEENRRRVKAEIEKIQGMIIRKESEFVKQGLMTEDQMTFRRKKQK